MKLGIIILAAGNSSRMGKPKQLLEYKGKGLLEITTAAALKTSFRPIVVVLGAYAENIPQHNKVNFVINDSWENGMATSIAAGMSQILKIEPSLENVIIAVSDQPFISASIFNALAEEHSTTGKNVASRYAETIGTPALFNQKYFDELVGLEGNAGAKQILTQYANDVTTISFELGHIDIDTETDYNNLISQQ